MKRFTGIDQEIFSTIHLPVVWTCHKIIILLLLAATFLIQMTVNAPVYAEDLPWGKAKEPTLITPNAQNPVPRDEPIAPERTERFENQTPSYEPAPQAQPTEPNPGRDYVAPRPYEAPRRYDNSRDYDDRRYQNTRPGPDGYSPDRPQYANDTYSDSEILDAGHRLFGKVTEGLAKVVERTFSDIGRPNGYIIGEEAGGAFIAGLRYGEGTLHTKVYGVRKVYWQGPSIGYDFGAEGSKTMILVYRLRHPRQIYQNFAGVNGSAYFIGGVGLTYQRKDDIVLARIQSGVGVRLGANVGYLKYTRRPTWNPF